jgi:hypothetical protein
VNYNSFLLQIFAVPQELLQVIDISVVKMENGIGHTLEHYLHGGDFGVVVPLLGLTEAAANYDGLHPAADHQSHSAQEKRSSNILRHNNINLAHSPHVVNDNHSGRESDSTNTVSIESLTATSSEHVGDAIIFSPRAVARGETKEQRLFQGVE